LLLAVAGVAVEDLVLLQVLVDLVVALKDIPLQQQDQQEIFTLA
tara:strand:- start:510 stop:641 length:132 start_codon:yes stop_codon:yes gene_type:complete